MNIWQIISQIREDAPKHNVDPSNLIKRMTYGVGTRLITSQGDPALGGVYKLVAVEDKNEWIPAIKISESVEKIPTPGNKQVYRIYDITNKATADLVSLVDENISQDSKIILRHPFNQTKKRILDRSNFNEVEPLLVDVYNDGKLVYNFPTIEDIRKQRKSDLDRLDTGVKRLIYPHLYHVSITNKIWKLRSDLIDKLSSANGFKD
jgi:nicotinate phosphoribosyltransferase